MEYNIRTLEKSEYPLRKEFLYEAIFVPEGVEPPPRAILEVPELQVYIAGFGREEDDRALAVEADGRVVGAVWVRIMDDYGHVDNETLSFAVSLYKKYRGLGIGTEMMKRMLSILKDCGYRRASLAVQKANYAVRMYQRIGFDLASETEDEYIMVNRLQ